MTRTLLQSVNGALLAAGERPLTSSTGNLGDLVKQCLRDAASEVASGNKLENLRTRVAASSWSLDEATLPDSVNHIQGVFFYTSPDGMAETAYDYPTINVQYITPEEYERRTLYNYSNTSQAIPYFWTKKTYNVAKVNPYPTDATERAKIIFDVYQIPQIPATDGTNWSCADVVTDVLQLRAASMIAIRHLQDQNIYSVLYNDYQMLLKKLRGSQSPLPGGYSMYRQGRYRHSNWRSGY